MRHDDLHIVDQLIYERAQRLSSLSVWPILRPLLFRLFFYEEAVRLADEIRPMGGSEMMSFLCNLLNLDVRIEGKENIPAKGGFILVANHPTGLADGLAVYQALEPIRPDMAIFANRDALRVNPNMSEVTIPVEWRDSEKSFSKNRDTVQASALAFRQKRAIVLFPSGRIAFWKDGKLRERPWRTSAVVLAQKYKVPIVPAGISSRNSGLFYLLSKYHTELRDMMLFRELLNKKGLSIRMRIAAPIGPEALEGDAETHTAHLQKLTTEELAGLSI